MYWFVIVPESERIDFTCSDDLEGRKKVVEFLSEVENEYGWKPSQCMVFRGEQHKFVPPSSKGDLIQCS